MKIRDKINGSFFVLILIEVIWMMILLLIFNSKLNQLVPKNIVSDTYYLPAVIVNYDSSTTTFEDIDGRYQYTTKTLSGFDMNTEYLLTMGTNGTSTKDDDTIIVVWKDTN